MPENPFISRDDWRKDKVKYGIPDAVLKYSFGEKMQSLRDKFDKAGLKGPMTLKKVPAAEELVKEGNKAFEEFVKGLNADKVKKKTKDHAGALKRLELYKGYIGGLERACIGTRDVFAGPRRDYPKCVTQLEQAKKMPTDANALQTLYSQGMRNHLGATYHAALTTYRGGVVKVPGLLKDYEELLKGWHDSMQGNGPTGVAKDKEKREAFLEDMEKALKIGKEILDLTA